MKSQLARVLTLAASGWLAAVLARPAGLVLTPIPESEPNNTPATATPLTLAGNCQAAAGAISPAADVDYYSFTAPAGARLWALVDTGPSTTNRDSILTLFGPDGTIVIETDDDDGLGNDCDATLGPGGPPGVESAQGSSVAGRTLTAGGTYFLRVEAFSPASTITAYKLFVVVSTTSTAESEPNNTAATANSLVTAVSPIGVRTAAIGTVGDVDFYSLTLTAAATFFISADGDPERNGGTDNVVDLIAPNGSTVLLTVDNSDNVGFPAPPAESFCFTIATPGTYFVRVTGFNSATKMTTGTYDLMVAACGLPPTPTATPTLTATTIVGGPTATRTSTPQGTPQGGPPPNDIPTLSFPMLLLMGLGLVASAFLLVRRL